MEGNEHARNNERVFVDALRGTRKALLGTLAIFLGVEQCGEAQQVGNSNRIGAGLNFFIYLMPEYSLQRRPVRLVSAKKLEILINYFTTKTNRNNRGIAGARHKVASVVLRIPKQLVHFLLQLTGPEEEIVVKVECVQVNECLDQERVVVSKGFDWG